MALYHAVQGSVDYTIVGTPTIEDGVASGFSSSNYLQISQTYNATNNKNVEIYVRAKTPTTITSDFNPIFGATDNIGYWGISSYSNVGFAIRMGYSWSSSKSFSFKDMYISGGIQPDTWYRFKVTGNNGIWRAEIYNDNGTLLNSDDKNWTSNTLNENYTINLKCTDNTGVYSGAIDLKQTYIKIDGQPWFGLCSVEVQKHQIMGPVGYTVTGTPTIVDNVMSNFSNSNYATTTSAFEVANYDNVEIYVRAKTPVTTSSGWTDIIENGGVGSSRNLGAYANNELTSYYFNFFGHDFWRYNISADTWYRLKLTTTANTQSGYIYDDNGNLLYQGENWNRRIAGTSVLSFGGRYSPNKIGAIDFNNTYIKVNGKLWFYQPANTKYIVKDGSLVWADPKLYLTGPVNYEVVGTPTITDGVVSNFSNTNYIQTSENFSFENPLEIYFTATTSSDVNTSQLFCSVGNGNANRSLGVTIETGGKMGVAYTFNGSSWVGWLPSSYVFEGNTRYNFLIQYIPSQVFTINVKKATETSWTTFTNSISAPIYTSTDCPFIFGQNYQNKPFLGSIDFKDSYIKVNDQLWFYGKNYASKNIAPVPANYTYGNTTTSAIGWVDMRTQDFHEAPTGTTIEKDS